MDNDELRAATKPLLREAPAEDAPRAVEDVAHDDRWWDAHYRLFHKCQRGELAALAAVLGAGFVVSVCVAVLSDDYNLGGWMFGFVLLGCAASAYTRAVIRIKNRRVK
jgi:hypothetical protein